MLIPPPSQTYATTSQNFLFIDTLYWNIQMFKIVITQGALFFTHPLTKPCPILYSSSGRYYYGRDIDCDSYDA